MPRTNYEGVSTGCSGKRTKAFLNEELGDIVGKIYFLQEYVWDERHRPSQILRI